MEERASDREIGKELGAERIEKKEREIERERERERERKREEGVHTTPKGGKTSGKIADMFRTKERSEMIIMRVSRDRY